MRAAAYPLLQNKSANEIEKHEDLFPAPTKTTMSAGDASVERMAHKWRNEAQPATIEAVARRAVRAKRVSSLNIKLDPASDAPIMEQLAEGLAKNLSRVIDAFRSWDTDGSGMISKREFREGLARLGLEEVPREEMDALFDEVDADHSGEIEFGELQSKLRKRNPDAVKQEVVLDAHGRDVRRGWRNMANLRRVAPRPLMAPPAMAATLSPNLEVARRMAQKWHGDASPAALDAIVRRAVKQAGTLNMKLDPESDVPITEQLAEGLAKNMTRVVDVFRAWDADNSGTIDKSEFRHGLHQLGLTEVPLEEMDALFDEIDADESGEIDYRELAFKLKTKQRAKVSAAAAAAVAVPGSNRWLERRSQALTNDPQLKPSPWATQQARPPSPLMRSSSPSRLQMSLQMVSPMGRSGSSQRLSPSRRDPSRSPKRRDPSPKHLSPVSPRVKKLVATTLGDGDGGYRARRSPSPTRNRASPSRRAGGGGGSYSARGSSSSAHGGGGGGSYSARGSSSSAHGGGSYRARVGRDVGDGDEHHEPRRHHLPKVATSWEDAGVYAREAIEAAVSAASHAQKTARGAAAAADAAARSADDARRVAKKAAHLAVGLTGPNREQWLTSLSPRLSEDPETLIAQRGGRVPKILSKATPQRLSFDDVSTTPFLTAVA